MSDQYVCAHKVWATDWHQTRCGKPAKFWVDVGGSFRAPVCGIHANTARRQSRKVEPIGAASPTPTVDEAPYDGPIAQDPPHDY